MLRMVWLLELPMDMPATSSRNFAAFRCHNCQTSSLMAFALLFCAIPFLGTGLPLKSPCCIRRNAVWLRVGSNRLKPQSNNCAACGLPFWRLSTLADMHLHPGGAPEPLCGAFSIVWRLSDGVVLGSATHCGFACTWRVSGMGPFAEFFLWSALRCSRAIVALCDANTHQSCSSLRRRLEVVPPIVRRQAAPSLTHLIVL